MDCIRLRMERFLVFAVQSLVVTFWIENQGDLMHGLASLTTCGDGHASRIYRYEARGCTCMSPHRCMRRRLMARDTGQQCKPKHEVWNCIRPKMGRADNMGKGAKLTACR